MRHPFSPSYIASDLCRGVASAVLHLLQFSSGSGTEISVRYRSVGSSLIGFMWAVTGRRQTAPRDVLCVLGCLWDAAAP